MTKLSLLTCYIIIWENGGKKHYQWCVRTLQIGGAKYLTYALKLLLRPILIKNLNRWISRARLDHEFYLNKYGSYWVFTNKIAAQVSKSNESTCNLLRVKIALSTWCGFCDLHLPPRVHSLKFKVQLQFLNQLVRGKSSGLNRGSWLKHAALKTAVLKNAVLYFFSAF